MTADFVANRSALLWCQHSVNQSIANDTWTTLAWDQEVVDPDGLHDPTDNTKFFFRPSGLYAAVAQISWAPSGVGGRGIRFLQDTLVVSSAFVLGMAITALPASTDQAHQCTMQPGGVTDAFFQVQVWQNSGAALNCTKVGFDTPSLMLCRLGAL